MKTPRSASRPMPGPFALPLRIKQEHLQRFDQSLPSRFSAQTVTFRQRKSRLYKYGSDRSLSIDARVSSWLPNAISQYLHHITSRFSQRVKQLGKFSPANMIFVAMPSGFSTSTTWARTALASTLAGPTAGRTLLLDLTGNMSSAESSSGEKAISQAQEQKANVSVPGIMPPEILAPQARSAAEAAQQGFYPQTGSLPLPEAGLDRGRPLFAPPLRAEVPATLLPPRVPFEAPTPFASATLRHEALRDEADLVQEDMDDLADKIKRILDEDARRHGIQV